jgi:cytochrome b subunit of formate dehydrogenase
MAAQGLENMSFWLMVYRLFHLIASTCSFVVCLGMMLYFNSFSQQLYNVMPSWLIEIAQSMHQSFGTLGYKLFWLTLAIYFLSVSYRMVSLLQEQP